ncbi:DUF190 domain-containing protein [Aequorivita sp. H23M31]|uniref:DUF190 domain-containing protein n=1 Tax=Aequorivita ciconiae TaxID=2494375 RepID=A0A410G5T5_9FLAO|nr:DUF190 domain-containing protein [Aequorivita sp. H23M31]QAA82632.1 DUF190 domain-containing protein [Aequorivita sp. H23M31]
MLQAQIYIDKDDLQGVKPLHKFIMQLLMENGIMGATSFVGFSGYGRHQILKQPGLQFSFDETPLLITFIDEQTKVKNALTELRKVYRGGLIITHAVEEW